MRIVTFKIDEELLNVLDLYCINNKLERSVAIRNAIELYLKEKAERTPLMEVVENERQEE
jgi:Ribbon-helix-helix protein, copG family.